MQVDVDAVKAAIIEQIEKDRAAINRTIKEIQEELSVAPYGGKVALTHEQRYRKLALTYYLNKNQSAITEIDRFAEYSLGFAVDCFRESFQGGVAIAFALDQRLLSLNTFLLDQLNYSYRRRRTRLDIYHPDDLQEIDHRFLSLPAPVYAEVFPVIKVAYQNRHRSDEYLELAETYIESYVLPALSANSRSNAYLFRKAEIIDHIVDRFAVRDYISLSYLVPPLIEGTFHSICGSLGLRAAKLMKAALNQIVERIKEHTDAIGMEYLLFLMPMRRNLIAHGRELDVTYREFAVGFLVDIDLLLMVAKHPTLPWNALLYIVRNPSVGGIKGIFTFMNEDLPLHVSDECRKLGDWLESSTFWIELDLQLTERDIRQKETERFVKKLLSRSSELAAPDTASRITEQCRGFLRETLPAAKVRLDAKKCRMDKIYKTIRIQINPQGV